MKYSFRQNRASRIANLHLYADGDDLALAVQVGDIVSVWRSAVVSSNLDARWRAIRHLTG